MELNELLEINSALFDILHMTKLIISTTEINTRINIISGFFSTLELSRFTAPPPPPPQYIQ